MGLKPKKIGLKILLLSEKIKIKRFLGQICRLGRFGQSYNLKIKFSPLSVDAAFGFFYTDNDRLPLNSTVPFHSIRQSRVTGPQKSTKCHDGHGHFGEVTKSFLDSKN